MDLHAGQIMGFFDIPVDNLNALPVVLPYLRSKYGSENVVIVSPDAGGVERARYYAQKFNDAQMAIIDKRRGAPNQVAAMNVVGDVRDRTCILVDDMVDTAGTLVKAAETLVQHGARKVVASCVHPVLSGNAIERINNSILEELIVTDTIVIPRSVQSKKITVLSVASLIAEGIRRTHSDDSLSSIFV